MDHKEIVKYFYEEIVSKKLLHHACGHQASFSVRKIDDTVFSVHFFYVIFIY